jgi:hypothetical protein
MKTTAFWDVAPCSLIEIYQRFKCTYCHHLHGDRTIYSLKYTDIPKVFFALHHIGHCCTHVTRSLCCY